MEKNLEWKGTAVTSLEPRSTLLEPASSHFRFEFPRSSVGTAINLHTEKCKYFNIRFRAEGLQ